MIDMDGILVVAIVAVFLVIVGFGSYMLMVAVLKSKFKKVAAMTGLAITESSLFSVVLSGSYKGREVSLTGRPTGWFSGIFAPVIFLRVDGKIVFEKIYLYFFEVTLKKENIKQLIDDYVK